MPLLHIPWNKTWMSENVITSSLLLTQTWNENWTIFLKKKKSFSWKTRNHWLEIIIAGSKKEYSMKIIYEELTAFVSVEFALNPLCQKIVSHNDFSCGWSMPLDIIFHNDINVLVWHWWKLVWIGPNSTISHAVVQLEIPNMDAIFFRGN